MEVKLERISYEELKKGLSFDNDPYAVLSYQYETRRETLLANPCLDDYSMDYMVVGVADKEIIGRDMFFPIKFKMGEKIVDAYCGSSFLVIEKFRKDPIGAEFFLHKINNKPYEIIVASGISDMALPFHKVTKRTIFSFPIFWQIRSTRSFLNKIGLKGGALSIVAFLFDLPLKLFRNWQLRDKVKKSTDYIIKKEVKVPEWVDDVVLNDGHKYMEIHNQKWLQWNLDFNFCGGSNNYQSFYVIEHFNKTAGFFMIKHREYENKWRLKNAKIASIVEWGVCQGEVLTELDIIRFASNILDVDVDILELATTDINLANLLKKRKFVSMGNANVSIHDIKKQYLDKKEMGLWRLRLGYADVILST